MLFGIFLISTSTYRLLPPSTQGTTGRHGNTFIKTVREAARKNQHFDLWRLGLHAVVARVHQALISEEEGRA